MLHCPDLAGPALGLTGRGPGAMADVEREAHRVEKDDIFTAYVQDIYGEEYPAVNESMGDLPGQCCGSALPSTRGHPLRH